MILNYQLRMDGLPPFYRKSQAMPLLSTLHERLLNNGPTKFDAAPQKMKIN